MWSCRARAKPDNRPLEVLGEISANLAYRDTSCDHPVYIVKKLQQNLLSLPAIWSLNILAQVDAIVKSVPDQFPVVFTGLGTFPDTYQVKLKPDAEPFALFTPRNVPIPLRPKVQEELSRMKCHIESRTANTVVFRDGRGAKEDRIRSHLCGL